MRNKKHFKKPVAQLQFNCRSFEELQETLLHVSTVLLRIRERLLLQALREKVKEAQELLAKKEAEHQSAPVSNVKRHRRHGHKESRK